MHSFLEVVVDHAGRCANREFAELPRLCPVCQQVGQPFQLAARSTDVDDASVDFAFQCSRPGCRRVFVASYHLGLNGEFELDHAGSEPWQQPIPAEHA